MTPLGRLVGLPKEPPVPPGTHERLIEALEMLHDRETVHHHKPSYDVRMIHGGAERDERAAVVADHRELLVA